MEEQTNDLEVPRNPHVRLQARVPYSLNTFKVYCASNHQCQARITDHAEKRDHWRCLQQADTEQC